MSYATVYFALVSSATDGVGVALLRRNAGSSLQYEFEISTCACLRVDIALAVTGGDYS